MGKPDIVGQSTEAASTTGVRGIPVSKRIWKPVHKKASSIIADKSFKQSWDKKQKIRRERKELQEKERELQEVRKSQQAEERRIAEERKKRKEENRQKSVKVQVITDTRKLKKMSKKQLKQIVKR
eukprot:TRINITY_DN5104_c0_g1_i1.p1 TRINITY_DN5104_c0_g1~~TRINITY_DN5104_c0_g1_i1.p1  ORF type:complete len:125 (+),score=33.28 TRINITY_DN5104_c0_g1_i1:25-399(+)